jgi:translation initiation factor 3 subunit I
MYRMLSHFTSLDIHFLPKPSSYLLLLLKRPFLLQGHERPITVVKYNYDGDLLFTASKDQIPSMWRSESGERVGTFHGHKGTIWDLDADRFSKHLLTASADA